jgi:hypothetical protein
LQQHGAVRALLLLLLLLLVWALVACRTVPQALARAW